MLWGTGGVWATPPVPQSLYASWFQAYDGRRGGLFLIVCFLQIGSLLLADRQLASWWLAAYCSHTVCLLLTANVLTSRRQGQHQHWQQLLFLCLRKGWQDTVRRQSQIFYFVFVRCHPQDCRMTLFYIAQSQIRRL